MISTHFRNIPILTMLAGLKRDSIYVPHNQNEWIHIKMFITTIEN